MQAPFSTPPVPIEASESAPGLEGRRHRLDERLVPCERLGGAVLVGGLALGLTIGMLYLLLGEHVAGARIALLGGVGGLVLAALGALAWFHPPLKLATSSWTLSPEGLEIRSGVWFQHLRTVPRERVQHTDVERGPIERRFGLATLVVHTAGHQDSEIRFDGLAHETATALRDQILARGDPRRGE
jgi:hypothetical protein